MPWSRGLSQETAAEMLQRAEMRDAWLGVLLPVCVAALLMLVLIVRRQRRRGSTAFDGLFRARRLPDTRSWFRKAADRARESEKGQSAAATDAATAKAAGDLERQSHAIVDRDGVPLLSVDQRVLIQTLGTERDERIADITDAGITLYLDEHPVIAWEQIRRISVREGPERKWWIPITLAVLGAAPLGYVGWWIDMLTQSTSGRNPNGAAMMLGMLVGALVAGGLGMLIMYAFQGATWITLVDAPPAAPLTRATFADRAREARARTPERLRDLARCLVLVAALAPTGSCGWDGGNVLAPPTIVFLVQPSTTKAGTAISPAVQVEVRYPGDDDAVTTWSTPITISLQDGPTGTTLSGTTTRTPVNGRVIFDNLVIGQTFSGYRLNVASGVIPGVLSEPFAIVP